MKIHLAARMRLSALVIAGALGTFALVTPHLLVAQSAPEKISLMADTLRARDSGNLDLAKEKAEELIKIAPDDENVQLLLAAINRELDRRGGRIAPAVDGQAGINLEESSIKVNKHITESEETETRTLKVRADEPSSALPFATPETNARVEADSFFDSMF